MRFPMQKKRGESFRCSTCCALRDDICFSLLAPCFFFPFFPLSSSAAVHAVTMHWARLLAIFQSVALLPTFAALQLARAIVQGSDRSAIMVRSISFSPHAFPILR